MCQLMGFCSENPVGFSAAFREFRKRAETNPHAWGIALWSGVDECGPLVIRDPRRADKSKVAGLLANNVIPGKILVAHIRYGTTRGPESLRTVTNAHPFVANIDGRDWAFAHNGFVRIEANAWHRHRPHGTTDSEKVFSLLVEKFRGMLGREGKIRAIKETVKECAGKGKLNFLLSDGEHLFFFSNMNEGLFYREMVSGKKSGRVTLVATKPIGKGSWKACEPGVVYTAKDGRVVREDVATTAVHVPKAKKASVFETLPFFYTEDVSDWRLYEQMNWDEIKEKTSPAKKARRCQDAQRYKSYIDYLEEAVAKGGEIDAKLPARVHAH